MCAHSMDVKGLVQTTARTLRVSGMSCESEPLDLPGRTHEEAAIRCSARHHPRMPSEPDLIEVTQDGIVRTFEVHREVKYTVKNLRGGE